jgi:CheY-like chemotaxis protein
VSTTGGNSGDFAVNTSALPASIAAGALTKVIATFNPTPPGIRSTTMSGKVAPTLLLSGLPNHAPMKYSSDSPDTLCLEPEPEVAPTTAQAEAPAPRKVVTQRVLLLDDDDDFRNVISDYLISRFFKVTSVTNGAEGLKEILTEPFDLIVCDMMMPQVDGEMFYWAVTRIRPAARLRFLFVTGHQHDAKVQSFFQRVDATVLTKPFTFEALNSAIVDVAKKVRG